MGMVGDEKTGAAGRRARGLASEDLPMELADRFGAVSPAYVKWLQSRWRDRGGLSYERMRLLGALLWSEGPLIMSGLGSMLGVTPRNVTKLVDALEGEGMVERRPHPTDRRATLIGLTERGKEKAGGEWDERRAAASELFDGLSEEDQRELIRLLDLLQVELRNKGVVYRAPGRIEVQQPPNH